MSQHDPHHVASHVATPADTSVSRETFAGLLNNFFPSRSEFVTFVGGLIWGVVLLAVLAGLGYLVGGHLGIWPTF